MHRILLGLALACTTPACMHLESAPQRSAVQVHDSPSLAPRSLAQRSVPTQRNVPRRPRAAFEAPPVAPADGGDLPLQIAAGAAIALGVFLYVE